MQGSRGKSLLGQQASLSAMVTYGALRQAQARICSCSTAVSPSLVEYDYFLVEKSLAEFVIFQRQY